MAGFRTLDDLGDVRGKVALVRVDLHLPMDEGRAKKAALDASVTIAGPNGSRRQVRADAFMLGALEADLAEGAGVVVLAGEAVGVAPPIPPLQDARLVAVDQDRRQVGPGRGAPGRRRAGGARAGGARTMTAAP